MFRKCEMNGGEWERLAHERMTHFNFKWRFKIIYFESHIHRNVTYNNGNFSKNKI